MSEAHLRPEYTPPTPTDAIASTESKTSAMGRIVSKGTESEMQLITVPLALASSATRFTSAAAHPILVKAVGGVGYVTSALVNTCFWGVKRGIEIAKSTKVAESSSKGATDAVRARMRQADAKAEATNTMQQAGVSGAKWATKLVVSLVPGLSTAGVLAEGAADATSKVLEIKKEAQNLSRKAATLQAFGAIKASQAALHVLGSLVWVVALGGEKASGYLKQLSIRAWQDPSALANALERGADQIDAWSFKMTQAADAGSFLMTEPSKGSEVDGAYIIRVMTKEITESELTSFCRSPRQRQEALTLVKHYEKTLSIPSEQIEKYAKCVKAMQAIGVDEEKLAVFLAQNENGKIAKELLALSTAIHDSLPAIYQSPKNITLPIQAKSEAKKVTSNEIDSFQGLTQNEQRAIVNAVSNSKKLQLGPHFTLPIEEQQTLRELIGLFKALPLVEKEELLPSLQVKLQINTREAGILVTDGELSQKMGELEDILYKALHAKTTSLSSTDKARFQQAVENKNAPQFKQALKELVGFYARLPANDKSCLTPSIFNNLDDTLKLEVFHLVANFAPNLTMAERAYITDEKMREVHLNHSFCHLSEHERRRLDLFLIEKFNTLPADTKMKMYDLSFEAFQELPEKAKLKVVETFTEVSGLKPSSYSRQEMEPLLNAFNTKLTLDEKIKVYSALQQSLVFLYLAKDEIESLITTYKTTLKTLPPESHEATNLTRMIEWLQEVHKPTEVKQAAPILRQASALDQKIDMKAIDAKIGTHVLSDQDKENVSRLGRFAHTAFRGIGRGTEGALNAIGYLSSPWWINQCMTQTANVGEFLLAFPLAQRSLMLALSRIPGTVQAEYGLQMLPQLIVSGSNKLMEIALGWGKNVADIIDDVQRVQNLTEQLERAKSIDYAAKIGSYTSRLADQDQSFTQTIESICKGGKAASQFVCRPEVYKYTSSVSGLKNLALDYQLTYGSKEFYEFLRKFITLRDLPPLPTTASEVTSATLSVDEEATKAIAEIIKDAASQEAAMIAGQLNGYLQSFLQTYTGQGIYHAAQSIIKSPLGQKTAAFVDKVKNTAESAKEITIDSLSKGTAMVGTGYRLATGAEELLPPALVEPFSQIVDISTKLAACQAEQKILNETIEALKQIKESTDFYNQWILLPAAKYIPAEIIKNFGGFEPKKITTYLESLWHVAKANEASLNDQLGTVGIDSLSEKINTPISEEVKLSMSTLGLKAVSKLAEEGAFSWKTVAGKGLQGLSMAGSASELMQMALGTTFFLPLMMRQFVPSLLRTYAPVVSEGVRPFWYSLAQRSYSTLDRTGEKAAIAVSATGNYLMQLTKMAQSQASGYISQQRVVNFTKLSELERTHLIDLAISSPQSTSGEKMQLEEMRMKLRGLDAEHWSVVAQPTLQVYDRFTTSEKLRISPTSFDTLDKGKQARVISVVDHYLGLSAAERNSSDDILKKYYLLSSHQQAKVDEMPIWEYANLSPSEQEDIRFILSTSPSVRKHYQVEAAENVGFTAAWTAFLEENSETSLETIAWTRDHFHKMNAMPNSELSKLLSVYHKLSDEEKAQLTPSRLGNMSKAKILHCYELVSRYHPEIVQGMKGTYDLEKLKKSLDGPREAQKVQNDKKAFLEGLALAFREMPLHEQNQFLLLTAGELQEFKKEEKHDILRKLASEVSLKPSLPRIQEELVKLEKGKELDPAFIVKCFNSLEFASLAEFRITHDLGMQARNELISSCQTSLTKIMGELQVLTPEIDRLRNIEFMAADLEYINAKNALEKTKADITRETDPLQRTTIQSKEKKQIAEFAATDSHRSTLLRTLLGLERYRDKLLSEAQALESLVGKEHTILDRIEEELQQRVPSSEIRLVKETRLATITALIANEFESTKKVLTGLVGGITECNRDIEKYDRLFDQQKLDLNLKLENYKALGLDLQSKAIKLGGEIERLFDAQASKSETKMKQALRECTSYHKEESRAMNENLVSLRERLKSLQKEREITIDAPLKREADIKISAITHDIQALVAKIEANTQRIDALEKAENVQEELQKELSSLQYERIDAQMMRQVVMNFWQALYKEIIAAFDDHRNSYKLSLAAIRATYKAD